MRTVLLAVTLILLASFAWTQEFTDPWEAMPGETAATIRASEPLGTTLISSDALSWPDGRSALITYWRAEGRDFIYRCVDYKNADFQATGHICWLLRPATR